MAIGNRLRANVNSGRAEISGSSLHKAENDSLDIY